MKRQVTKYLKIVIENYDDLFVDVGPGPVFTAIGEDEDGSVYYKGSDGLIRKSSRVDVFAPIGYIFEDDAVFVTEGGMLTGVSVDQCGDTSIPEGIGRCAVVVSSEFINAEDIKKENA